MAERYTEKRKLKRSFLIISNVSKFIKAHGIILLLFAVFIVLLILLILQFTPDPQPEPEPNKFDIIKQGVGDFWLTTKIGAGKAWGGITGFFGNIGAGIAGGFAAIGNFFGRLF